MRIWSTSVVSTRSTRTKTIQRFIQNRSSSLLFFTKHLICNRRNIKVYPSLQSLNKKQFHTSSSSAASDNIYTRIMSTSDMRRGMGGRIEESFATAKENGRAAFVSFVTAGYPTAQGM